EGEPHPAAGRSALRIGGTAAGGGIDERGAAHPQLAVVAEAVELRLRDRWRELRQVVAELEDRLDALVAEELRGIVGAAEEAAAVAALFGGQQRLAGVLAID